MTRESWNEMIHGQSQGLGEPTATKGQNLVAQLMELLMPVMHSVITSSQGKHRKEQLDIQMIINIL